MSLDINDTKKCNNAEDEEKDDFLQDLLAEINELNKEALSRKSRSTFNKSSSISSNNETQSSNSGDMCNIVPQTFSMGENELDIFSLDFSDHHYENVKEGTEQQNEIALSDSWINSTLPNTEHIIDFESKTKTVPLSDAKVKISIPLDTYAKKSGALKIKQSPEINKENQNNVNDKDFVEKEIFKQVTINKTGYFILSMLGYGGNSKVYNCFNVKKNRERAIKKIPYTPEIGTSILNEVNILKHLNMCNNIIHLYDYEIIDNYLYVVLEKGFFNLSTVVKEHFYKNEDLPMYKIMFYWREILNAVQQIHAKRIAHLDLKLSNFVQCYGCIKLIDFGTAVIVNDEEYAIKYEPVGSPNYVCPEAITNISHDLENVCQTFMVTLKSDIWSLGCILYQLVYRHQPFHHIKNTKKKLEAICDPTYKINYPDVKWIPNKVLEGIKMCLVHEMCKRPTIKQLKDYFI